MKERNSNGLFKRIELPVDEIIKAYKEGAFQNELAKKYGVSQHTIWNRLTEAGVTRTSGEARRLRWSRMTPEERFAQLDAAHIASHKKRSKHQKIQRALLNQTNHVLSKYEQSFKTLFDSHDITVISEYALDIYNIDFAIPEKKIAIEIDGGNWHGSPRKQRGDKGKEVLLRRRGWTLIRVGIDLIHKRMTVIIDLNSADILPVINAIYSYPTVFSENGMITS